jgi:hypothetical protein
LHHIFLHILWWQGNSFACNCSLPLVAV